MIASAYWCFWQNGIFENRYSTPSEESITKTKMSYTDLVWTSKNSKEGGASRQGTNNGENNIKGRQSKSDMFKLHTFRENITKPQGRDF